jgi:hypothetical protein
MVHSPALTVSIDSQHLMRGVFSLGKTVCSGNLEFITDCFGGMSLCPKRNDSGTAFMGSTRSGPLSPQRAMIEDSTEGFYTTSSGERF